MTKNPEGVGGFVINRRHVLQGGLILGLLPSCTTVQAPRMIPVGQSQKLPTVPYPGKQDDIAFASPSRGWYGNGTGLLYRTQDRGDSWEEIWSRPGTFIRALGFLDDDVGIMGNVGVGSFPNVIDRTPLYRTLDGGLTWTPVERIDGPIPDGICAIDIVRFTGIDRGERLPAVLVHAAGRVGGPAHYLRSYDSGSTWQCQDLGSLTAAIFDVKFLGPRIGFLAGTSSPDLAKASGLILKTEDGGDTWREVFRSERPFETVWKLHFPSDGTGFGTVQSYDPDKAVSQRYIAKTMDAGDNWSEVPLVDDAGWRSFGIGFADDRLGWVGGNSGGLETRDGGSSWRRVEMGRAVNKIRFVEAPDRRLAYAIGSEVHRLELAEETGF